MKAKPIEAEINSMSLDVIVDAVDQLYIGEKYELFRVLLRDQGLKAFRELKRKQRERVRAQKATARPHRHKKRAA